MGTKNGSYISSDVALYYLTLGEGYFKENGNIGEYSAYSIMNLIENNQQMTPLEKQEVWEVIIYLKMKSLTIEVFTSGKQFPADFLGNCSIVREWDKQLTRFNIYLLYNKWAKVHNFGDVPKWEEFQDFYGTYKKKLNKKQLIVLEEEEYKGILTPKLNDLYEVRSKIYEEKGKLDVLEKIKMGGWYYPIEKYSGKAIYELEDCLALFEDKYPSIKTNNGGKKIQDTKMRLEFLKLTNTVTEGISSYGDWFYETELLG